MKTFTRSALAVLLMCFCQVASAAQSGSGGSGKTDGGDQAKERPVLRKAIIKKKPSPDYPKEAEEYRATAVIKLRMLLRSSGEVTHIEAVKVTVPEGLPSEVTDAFVREAVKAAGKIEFEPATKDGQPVNQFLYVEYNFTT